MADDKIYWFTHPYMLWDYCNRAVDKFLPENEPLKNFKRRQSKFKKDSRESYNKESVDNVKNLFKK